MNPGAFDRIPGGFDGHGRHILIETGDALFFDRYTALATLPDAEDLRRGEAVTGHIGAVANDPDRAGGFE